ncbi:biosynthetic-type acetolactate synthase large subunit [Halosegnis rubeus]|jgi:acetolactate synthase-1/2/3 large subunit|uniref:Acetolactate synthase n=1 Tax=Halosegnis rubeus TaxID=2212850 RepID=A0A5N5U1M1_9EURY|nr:biosynthetic-type acetolactate synthase large subunit [Halosegnis rubeus]KAB7512453.1 biosynthetic-type acetolactate synthase large subunit [Halosegnis rubeus]KAB7512713.1 biosynthetic-type acetolactate synthase large subunit [Halosegnis rubeus]KAB7514118.1 biosynthetic-type acetolactate synthase large subunit [Halosegnis rubeus]
MSSEQTTASDQSDEPTPVTTGAESVVRALENAGVEHLFGVQGGAIMPVYDALYDSEMTHLTMAHEQGAVHAADAYGAVDGDPGICLATSGPGATNLVTGIADADMDSDPVLALTGQVPTDFVGSDAFQETDTTGVTRPITKENYFADDPDSVGDTVGEAFAMANRGRQGPTLVDLPKDVSNGETDREPGPPRTPPTYVPAETADERAVGRAADALQQADRPVILAGGGVIRAEASEQLREFAIEHEIPVVTTMPGIGAFPEDHDLSLEWGGMHGSGYANMALTMTDCMFAVGTRFDDRLTGGVETFAPDAEIIHIDIDPAEISKNVEADFGLVGDARAVIEQFAAAMDRSPDTADWCERCRDWKQEYPLDYHIDEDDPVKPQFVVEAVDAATDDDTVVTTGVGQHQMWACQYWTFTQPRTWISSHGLGTMGYGVPAAIGARVAADDDQTVVCFDGDGSFLMTCQELTVAAREQMDITVFVLNNQFIGMVRQWQDGFFEGRRMASEYDWMPKFDAVAEAFGAEGFAIDGYDDVEATIEAALDYEGPSVVDVRIAPEEDVFPMVPSGGDNGLFALRGEHL